MSVAQQLGLEAIVCLEQRPAILVRDGDFGVPPETWSVLRGHRAGIKNSIQRVGRIAAAVWLRLRPARRTLTVQILSVCNSTIEEMFTSLNYCFLWIEPDHCCSDTHAHAHIYMYLHIYIYIYIYGGRLPHPPCGPVVGEAPMIATELAIAVLVSLFHVYFDVDGLDLYLFVKHRVVANTLLYRIY